MTSACSCYTRSRQGRPEGPPDVLGKQRGSADGVEVQPPGPPAPPVFNSHVTEWKEAKGVAVQFSVRHAQRGQLPARTGTAILTAKTSSSGDQADGSVLQRFLHHDSYFTTLSTRTLEIAAPEGPPGHADCQSGTSCWSTEPREKRLCCCDSHVFFFTL